MNFLFEILRLERHWGNNIVLFIEFCDHPKFLNIPLPHIKIFILDPTCPSEKLDIHFLHFLKHNARAGNLGSIAEVQLLQTLMWEGFMKREGSYWNYYLIER